MLETAALPDEFGYYGPFGGRYVPETLVAALDELEASFQRHHRDAAFVDEPRRPSPLLRRPSHAHVPRPRLSKKLGGAQLYLKREDLAHTGAHKINNALGQGLLARVSGKQRVIAETGAGQHGVASATVCAMLGLDCVVYMGDEDVHRQALNVARMHTLGAEVVPVMSGTRTLKDAINEALRDWVTNVETTFYLFGSATGPHPYPKIVREFQRVIGRESRAQIQEQYGGLPNTVVACVNGGSNAIGIFDAFIQDPDVALIGVEAGGRSLTPGQHAATLEHGSPGILHGANSLLLQDGRRTGARNAQHRRRPRLPRRRTGTRLLTGNRPGELRLRHRCRSSRRPQPPGAHRGNHRGPRKRPRPRLCHPNGARG